MIKKCSNCQKEFDGNRKQLFCSDDCKSPKAKTEQGAQEGNKEVPEAKVIQLPKTEPTKKRNNLLDGIVVTKEDIDNMSSNLSPFDKLRRKQKCGF